MRHNAPVLVALAALWVGCGTPSPRNQPDAAREALARTAALLNRAQRVYVEARWTEIGEHAGPNGRLGETRVWVEKPGKARRDLVIGKDSISGQILDGTAYWLFESGEGYHQYWKQSYRPSTVEVLPHPFGPLIFGGDIEKFLENATDARAEPDSSGDVPCVVVRWHIERQPDASESTATRFAVDRSLWIDLPGTPRRFKERVVRVQGQHRTLWFEQTTNYTRFDLDPKWASDPFRYEPPAGAVDMIANETEELLAKLPPIGAQARDFQLSDLDGNAIHLSDYRGKSAVLYFWSTG
jgi:hypothetical protein